MAEVSLELIQTMLQRVLDMLGRQSHEFGELKQRMSSVEMQVVGLRRDLANDAESTVNMRHGLDRLDRPVDRIERRLAASEQKAL